MRQFRLHRSAVIFWTAAIALAVVTGVFIAGVVGNAEEQAARFGALQRVLVARRPVPMGARLTAADAVERTMPQAFVPRGPLARSPFGKTVLMALAPGEVLLASKFAPEGLRGVAALLRAGERALALPLGPGTPPLAPNDRVDVVATTPSDGVTTVVAHAARVVGLDDRAVTVAVAAAEAPAVAAALATATVTLALAAQ